jgi:peptide-methionine (S)-S-oxide reductase
MKNLPILLGLLLLAGLLLAGLAGAAPAKPAPAPAPAAGHPVAKAAFAGGCFWCMQPAFERVPGVLKVTAGYAGGQKKNPTYEEVSSGGTGHAESVEVVFDPAKVSYAKLLDVFWHNVDPTTPDRQFCDGGHQYRTAVFYYDEAQHRLAEETKAAIEKAKGWRIVTEIVPASTFYPAEEYHQDYYKKNPIRYKFYRYNCGRDQRLAELWGKAPAE